MKYFVILLLVISACSKSKSDLSDSQDFTGTLVNHYPQDTITKEGWKLEYVLNNKLNQGDICVRWGKDNFSQQHIFKDVLEMRSYFIPTFLAETDNYIFMEHGCATDCSAITVLPKEHGLVKTFTHVLDYSVDYGQIVYLNVESYKTGRPIIEAYDTATNTTRRVAFKSHCAMTLPNACIDTITISKNNITLSGTFSDEFGEPAKEVQTIQI